MRSVFGYCRVSSIKQVENGISLEAQEEKIRAWATLNDSKLADVHTDAGISGKRGEPEGVKCKY